MRKKKVLTLKPGRQSSGPIANWGSAEIIIEFLRDATGKNIKTWQVMSKLNK